jgi:methylamine---glutamate N-methyltransferase subunit B
MAALTDMQLVDLDKTSVRELNTSLHARDIEPHWTISNPAGRHNVAVGVDQPCHIWIEGHVGYYCAGMNQRADIVIEGSAGVGVAENMMSGSVHVHGDVSQSAAATAQGGLLVVDGNAGARCGISMKGVDIVVGGNIGHLSAFMAQAGRLVVCGDAGDGLGDSIYEARLYVRGGVKSLGADCVEKAMRPEHLDELQELLDSAGRSEKAVEFRRFGSARKLYNFHVDEVGNY